MGVDHEMSALASRQHGLVERHQLRRLGMSSAAVDRRVTAGRLQRVHCEVFRVAGAPATWEQQLLAACLAAGAHAAVSHRAAARLWNLHDCDPVVEIATPRSQWPRLPHVVVHRSTDLRPDHVTVRHGVPVTKPSRVLVDLGAVAPAWVVEEALDRALVARLLTPRAADAILDDVGRKGRTGVGVLRRVLDDRALGRGVPDGLLEPRMARLLRSADVEAPAFQHVVVDAVGAFVGRVDFAWPARMLAVEVDGFAAHGSPAAMTRDLTRQNRLVACGWTVLRFTWEQVVRRPGHVTAALRPFLSP